MLHLASRLGIAVLRPSLAVMTFEELLCTHCERARKTTLLCMLQARKGLGADEAAQRLDLVGSSIPYKATSWLRLFVDECCRPCVCHTQNWWSTSDTALLARCESLVKTLSRHLAYADCNPCCHRGLVFWLVLFLVTSLKTLFACFAGFTCTIT